MKHIHTVSTIPAVAEIDIPALVKASADSVAVLTIGITIGKLALNLNTQIDNIAGQINLQSKTA